MRENAPRHVLTLDGSSTLYSPKYDQHYHSVNGAIKESLHVFIEAGLMPFISTRKELNVFEMGMGTGLNVLLTHLHRRATSIIYTTVELEPISLDQLTYLNYQSTLKQASAAAFLQKIHDAPWNFETKLAEDFILHKIQKSLLEFHSEPQFDLVYFDAFAPDAQPELWTEEVFAKIFSWCLPGAILTTYSAKGAVRRAMESVGFEVEKLPGPPGKREMIRARVPLS